MPDSFQESADGVNCGYQSYVSGDNYFNLMVKQGTNVLKCQIKNQQIVINGVDTAIRALKSN